MNEILISPASNIESWLHCQQIRSAAFLTTEPYEEEFDGKDFEMVTHLLATLNDIPVACMRLTIQSIDNGGTINWQRLALMPNIASRNRLAILNAIANYAEEYSFQMGFKKIISEVANKSLIKFWVRRGFFLTGEPPSYYGGKEYAHLAKTEYRRQLNRCYS